MELRGEPYLDPATCPHSNGTNAQGECVQCGRTAGEAEWAMKALGYAPDTPCEIQVKDEGLGVTVRLLLPRPTPGEC